MEIPSVLIDDVRSGAVVLVLGAGASMGATNTQGEEAPAGRELAETLSTKFLGGAHANDPLRHIAELAMSETSLADVQDYIRDIFKDIHPAPFHRLLTTFSWSALATTNFDLVIERAYDQNQQRVQDLVPLIKNGDRVDENLRSNRSLMLLKLHGCITRTHDDDLPLILSVDQYLTHKANRDRVFDHLKNLAYEHPIIFVGHSLEDPDMRQLLLDLGEPFKRRRFFSVTPELSDQERRLWQGRNITPLIGTFEEFLTTLDEEMPNPFTRVAVPRSNDNIPIAERFTANNPSLSSDFIEFLDGDVHYVRNGMPIDNVEPRSFYKGFNPVWSAVAQDFDVRRDIEDDIVVNTVIDDEDVDGCRLYTIRGHAGSGKSVLLQRIAWESATIYHKLCLYMRPHARISIEALRELSDITDERIYLFVDDINEHSNHIYRLITASQRLQIPLSIFGAARINEWNVSCANLESFVDQDFEVRYLSAQEIDRLLELLEKHNSLYRLEQASPQQRRDAFIQRAGRQLLVALHEATLGKPFEEIVFDEYSQIQPTDARSIYLGICFLNRYDVDVRAGIISRVYGVRFTEFRDQFFHPLEGLVFTRFNDRTRDYDYTTRHPYIANLVTARALNSPDLKLKTYLRVIDSMNIDYASDRKAFRNLIRGRVLLNDFPDHQMVQTIYMQARLKARNDPYLSHQMGIYEMHRRDGDLNEAHDRLNEAKTLAPRDQTVVHSLAELSLKRAEIARTDLEFRKHLNDAQSVARSLANQSARTSYGYHTLAKSYLVQLQRYLSFDREDSIDETFIQTVENAERVIQEGMRRFPDDEYLLTAESDLAALLSDDFRSVEALRTAFYGNPDSPFIAIRLAKTLIDMNEPDKAAAVYAASLESGVIDQQVHFNYAKLLMTLEDADGLEIEYHLRRAFTEGDRNVETQFWYARQLYVNNKISDAQSRFEQLRDTKVSLELKRKIRGVVTENARTLKFAGRIGHLASEFGYVIRDGTADSIYLHQSNFDMMVWTRLVQGARIRFAISFNFWGPTAIDISLENRSVG